MGMIYLRVSADGGGELVAKVGNDTFVHKLDMAGLLALLEVASRIALVTYRDEKTHDH